MTQVAPPQQIIKSKKAWLLGVLESRFGVWVTNAELKALADAAGLGMNQITARISDLRDDLWKEEPKRGVFSEPVDADKGQWRYRLDYVTDEYAKDYLGRRKLVALQLTVVDLEDLYVAVVKPTPDEEEALVDDFYQWDYSTYMDIADRIGSGIENGKTILAAARAAFEAVLA